MDLVFKRYSSPFLLIDNLISAKRLLDFILELIDAINDEKLYEMWLHRIYDKSYPDFKNEVMDYNKTANADVQDIETTVNESMNILNNFKPT